MKDQLLQALDHLEKVSTAIEGYQARIRDLETALRWVKEHGSKSGMPDEVFAILSTIKEL